jgi:hypothetical protein
MCNISLRALKAYERDERDPPSSFVLHLYKQNSINPAWLLAGDGAMLSTKLFEYLEAALAAVHTFCKVRKVELSAEKEARLVLLLAEYFGEGGEPGGQVQSKILENAI